MEEILSAFPDFDFESFYEIAKGLYDLLHHPDYEKWAKIYLTGKKCKKEYEFAVGCIQNTSSIHLSEVIKSNLTDFDGMHQELKKMDCLNDVKSDYCYKFKSMIIENPNYDFLAKFQAAFGKATEFLFKIQNSLHDRIDSWEYLYKTRPGPG